MQNEMALLRDLKGNKARHIDAVLRCEIIISSLFIISEIRLPESINLCVHVPMSLFWVRVVESFRTRANHAWKVIAKFWRNYRKRQRVYHEESVKTGSADTHSVPNPVSEKSNKATNNKSTTIRERSTQDFRGSKANEQSRSDISHNSPSAPDVTMAVQGVLSHKRNHVCSCSSDQQFALPLVTAFPRATAHFADTRVPTTSSRRNIWWMPVRVLFCITEESSRMQRIARTE